MINVSYSVFSPKSFRLTSCSLDDSNSNSEAPALFYFSCVVLFRLFCPSLLILCLPPFCNSVTASSPYLVPFAFLFFVCIIFSGFTTSSLLASSVRLCKNVIGSAPPQSVAHTLEMMAESFTGEK